MSTAQVAVVTGAGSGIGRSVALRLAVLGYRLTLVGRNESRLSRTVDAIEHSGSAPEVLLVPADVAVAEQAASVIELAADQWGRIDVVVNNAGIVRMAALSDTDEDLLFQTFATNTFGPAMLIARSWPHMVRQGSGCIVNVTSMATVDPFPGLGVYAASKCALDSLTRSLHNEGATHGIRAFSVAPGAVETPMLRGLFSTDQLPPDQTLEPADVAEVVVACVRGERDGEAGRSILVPSGAGAG
ncbi:MAG: SDR family NAD(P)-dependent oxidoreductase [Planctomycetota bacterium]|jgi:NAD(P)-dependent dehydrogenase (short-subunit alcohol dehydrogenase family)